MGVQVYSNAIQVFLNIFIKSNKKFTAEGFLASHHVLRSYLG